MPTATGRAPGHPPGLYVLFFTEMWERYSFYSLMSILTIYMDQELKFPLSTKAQVYGGYIFGVYLLPLLGGIIADRWLGYRRTILVGGLLITLGHFALAFEKLPLFYSALALLALGTGLLKPNISTMVGNLYVHQPERKDAAYNIFYMGINIGGFLGPLGVAYLRAHYGWSVALGSAGVAMLVSLGVFLFFSRYIEVAGRRTTQTAPGDRPPDPPDATARIVALLVLFLIVIAFWLAFYQNGFALTFWARDNTATTIPPEVFYATNSACIILFTLPLVRFWSWLNRRGQEPATTTKIIIGMLLTLVSFAIMVGAAWAGGDTGRVSPAWLVSSYAVIALAEICLSPMAMSLVAKIAPPRLQGVMMGAWFVTQALGGYFSGYVGIYWETIPHSEFFLWIIALNAFAALAMIVALRWLRPTFARAFAEETARVKIPA
jgi:POT family proton-dependent oligopeptide transporter